MKYMISALVIFLGVGYAVAQPATRRITSERDMVREPLEREDAEKQREQAEKAAAKRSLVEGEGVTYKQVMADPDNVELNYRYARAQLAQGDVRGASSTLERILLVNPGLHKVRLLYALVLYRLDNLNEAKRELETLTALSLTPSLRAELEELKALIEKRQRGTHIDISVGVGFDYNDNRTATPASEQLLFGNTLIALNPAHPVTHDTALIGLTSIKVTHDPGTQRGHEVFAGLSWYRAEQTVVDTLDLQAFSGNMGVILKSGANRIIPRFQWDHVYLSEQKYLERSMVAFGYERKLHDRLTVGFEPRAAFDDYIRTDDIAAAGERTGRQFDFAWDLKYVINPIMRVQTGYTLSEKRAERRYNAYERHSFNLGYSVLLGRGMFGLVNYTMNNDLYDIPDPMVTAAKTRDDITHRVRLTFGVPLSLLHEWGKDFVFTQSYEYYRAESNITNYAYDDNKFSSLLTYKWGY